jgi:hypothetical protein
MQHPWPGARARILIAGRPRKLAEAAMIPAANQVKALDDAAVLACLQALRMAIQARDTFPCAETTLTRDAAASALLKIAVVAPELGALPDTTGGQP